MLTATLATPHFAVASTFALSASSKSDFEEEDDFTSMSNTMSTVSMASAGTFNVAKSGRVRLTVSVDVIAGAAGIGGVAVGLASTAGICTGRVNVNETFRMGPTSSGPGAGIGGFALGFADGGGRKPTNWMNCAVALASLISASHAAASGPPIL
jgi:hypothetical protein